MLRRGVYAFTAAATVLGWATLALCFPRAGETTGDGPPVFSENLIQDQYGYAYGIAAADLDGDRRIDIAAVAERGANELRWWRNEGPRKKR